MELVDTTADEQEKVNFQDLPNEVILLIFSHLSPEDLACHAAKVCSLWLRIARDPVLWNKAALVYNDSYPLLFKKTIVFAPYLARLEINMFKFMTEDVIQSILSGCSSIKSFSFYPHHSMSLNDKLLILNHFKMSVQVMSMFLDDSYLSSSGSIGSLFQLLSNMKCLKSLTLRGLIPSKCLTPDMFCDNWKSLEALDISGLAIIYQSETPDLQNLNPWQNFILKMLEKKAKSLKKLFLPEGVFHHDLIGALEEKFVSSKIESLKICEMCLSVVRKLNFLASLHVVGLPAKLTHNLRSDCLLRGLQYSSMFNWIGDTPQLLSITDLTLENVNDDERSVTLKILRACQNLKCLTLSSVCHYPTELSAIILQSPALKSLSIYRTPCLRSKHLDLFPTYQPDLELLDIRYNTLTDGILRYYRDVIQSKMPQLKLICDWGYWNVCGGQPWPRPSASVSSESKQGADKSFTVDDQAKIRMVLDSVNDYGEDD